MSQTRVDHNSSLKNHAAQSAERSRSQPRPGASQPRPVARQIALPHERIAVRAYGLWQKKGCPHGQALATWLEAEAQLRREAGSN